MWVGLWGPGGPTDHTGGRRTGQDGFGLAVELVTLDAKVKIVLRILEPGNMNVMNQLLHMIGKLKQEGGRLLKTAQGL